MPLPLPVAMGVPVGVAVPLPPLPVWPPAAPHRALGRPHTGAVLRAPLQTTRAAHAVAGVLVTPPVTQRCFTDAVAEGVSIPSPECGYTGD